MSRPKISSRPAITPVASMIAAITLTPIAA
jgi:hypothetical protein